MSLPRESRKEEDGANTPRMMTIILAVSCQCVTCCSSMAGSTYAGMEPEFGVSREVCVLSISLFVAGLGVGPRE